MRVALTPRGPTLNFHVEKYSLCKDIAKALKHPRSGRKEYLSSPLLVMNNFTTQASVDGTSDAIRKQLESLTTTIFQSMFPPISPQNTPLSSIRRIMLVNREPSKDGSWTLSIRHYAIVTKLRGPSKRIRRLDPKEQRQREKQGKAIPNLSKLEDAADYLLDPTAGGYTSASETELDTENEVEVLETATRRVLNKKELQRQREAAADESGKVPRTNSTRSHVEKRAVKLVEIGPRLRLRMYKVEEGVCEGRVMWHDIISKSKKEEKELDAKWAARRKEKEERRRIQKENVERKKKDKEEARKNGKGGTEDKDDEEEEEESDEDMYDDDVWDSEDLDHEAEVENDDEGEEEMED